MKKENKLAAEAFGQSLNLFSQFVVQVFNVLCNSLVWYLFQNKELQWKMRSLWDQFHSDYRQVSNASIICEDGVIFTHKLVLAAVSQLLEQILSNIPAADEVTFYLKTYKKSKVEDSKFDLTNVFDEFESDNDMENIENREGGPMPVFEDIKSHVTSPFGHLIDDKTMDLD